MPELRPRGDHPAEPPDESPPPSADERWLSRFAAPEPADATATLEERIDSALAHHPEVASVVKRLAADEAHPLNVTQALADPTRRDATLATIAELADGRLLRDRSLAEYLADHPGTGPLFEPVAAEVNETTDRKTAYVDRCKTVDPARTAGPDPDVSGRAQVADYADRLLLAVEPAVFDEVADLAAPFGDVEVNARSKDASGLVDKVRRMAAGSESRPARPDYQVGDAIDAVGARITVADTRQLGELLDAAVDRFGVGEGGRILEIENMYAAPKRGNPAYRVIPLVVAIEVDGLPYTYELQLATRRASIAADLEHNTVYKPYVQVKPAEAAKIDEMFHEAAALEQEETRRALDDPTD